MRLNEHQNNGADYSRAGALRNGASPVEKKLWVVLREEAKARKFKFRRQVALHPYVADFACMETRLLVELDGSSHEARQNYDARREEDLRQMGFHVLRFSNDEITHNVEGVVQAIMAKAETLRKEQAGSLPLAGRVREGGVPLVVTFGFVSEPVSQASPPHP